MNRVQRGFAAEKCVEDYFLGKGLQVIQRRYWSKRAEIDLIVKDIEASLLLFVEVRSTTKNLSEPLLSISRKKIRSMHYAMLSFLQQYPVYMNYNYRLDLVVVKDLLVREHIENIFFD